MDQRRKHFKIDTFPTDVVEAVNKLFIAGKTHEEITDHLNALGHEITKSSVGRYGKNFLKVLEKTKLVTDQSKAILDATVGTGLQVEEAAVQIALSKIMEFLIDLEDIKKEEASKVFMALARLQSSGVQREKLKIVWREKVQAAAEKVKQVSVKKGLSPEDVAEIEKEVLGLVRAA